jgi:DHA2 family multidrug resistance protein
MAGSTEAPVAIRGAALAIAGIVLAASNFMVVLDTTIANVSVPHIAGSLGISTSQESGSSRPIPWRRRSAFR